jgi:hypothetical protein
MAFAVDTGQQLLNGCPSAAQRLGSGEGGMITFPSLSIDRDGDGPDTLILLQQDHHDGEGAHWVEMHPAQVKVLAERINLLAPDTEDKRTIARLGRQLRILLERVDQLDDWLNAVAQHGHESLDLETAYSLATWELAREFVKDLPPDEPQPEAPGGTAASRVTHAGQPRDNTPESGVPKDPQERGSWTGSQPAAADGLQGALL